MLIPCIPSLWVRVFISWLMVEAERHSVVTLVITQAIRFFDAFLFETNPIGALELPIGSPTGPQPRPTSAFSCMAGNKPLPRSDSRHNDLVVVQWSRGSPPSVHRQVPAHLDRSLTSVANKHGINPEGRCHGIGTHTRKTPFVHGSLTARPLSRVPFRIAHRNRKPCSISRPSVGGFGAKDPARCLLGAWLVPTKQSLVTGEQARPEGELLAYFCILYLYFPLAHSLLFGVAPFLTIT